VKELRQHEIRKNGEEAKVIGRGRIGKNIKRKIKG